MAEKEPIGWFTAHGRHVPIFEGQTRDEALKAQQIKWNKKEAENKNESNSANHKKFHDEQVKKLRSDKYEDGTYNVNTLKPVEYEDGYQFTFCQIGDDYSDAEYNALVNAVLSKIGSQDVFAGKFEGEPEISFHTKDRKFAEQFAKDHNQISIWDWKNCCEIKTGGTGRR